MASKVDSRRALPSGSGISSLGYRPIPVSIDTSVETSCMRCISSCRMAQRCNSLVWGCNAGGFVEACQNYSCGYCSECPTATLNLAGNNLARWVLAASLIANLWKWQSPFTRKCDTTSWEHWPFYTTNASALACLALTLTLTAAQCRQNT